MPEIARFHGIIVRMYSEVGERHHRPHLHAYAAGRQVAIAIDAVEKLEGELSVRHERLLLGWTELHLGELQRNWDLLQAGELPAKIDPLR